MLTFALGGHLYIMKETTCLPVVLGLEARPSNLADKSALSARLVFESWMDLRHGTDYKGSCLAVQCNGPHILRN